MDPKNWEKAFTFEGLKTRRNVNGELLTGLAADLKTEVPNSEASYEDFMRRIITKFMAPAAQNMYYYMSRATQNTVDNQKKSAAVAFEKLVKTFKNNWSQDEIRLPADAGKDANKLIQTPVERYWEHNGVKIKLPDPSAQDGNFYETSREIRRSIHRPDGTRPANDTNAARGLPINHLAAIDEIYAEYEHSEDIDGFCRDAKNYLAGHPELIRAYEAFNLFCATHWGSTNATISDYRDELVDDVSAAMATD